MDFKRIKDLLTDLGVGLAYKGYPYTVYLIWLASENTGLVTMPLLKELCNRTAAYFHVSRTVVEDDVRTMLNAYWNQQESAARFQEITGYPVIDRLTTKEFIFAVAGHLVETS